MRENMSFEFVRPVKLFGAAHMSPERTFVFLEGLVNQHVSLNFIFSVERGLTHRTFKWFLSRVDLCV